MLRIMFAVDSTVCQLLLQPRQVLSVRLQIFGCCDISTARIALMSFEKPVTHLAIHKGLCAVTITKDSSSIFISPEPFLLRRILKSRIFNEINVSNDANILKNFSTLFIFYIGIKPFCNRRGSMAQNLLDYI